MEHRELLAYTGSAFLHDKMQQKKNRIYFLGLSDSLGQPFPKWGCKDFKLQYEFCQTQMHPPLISLIHLSDTVLRKR